MWIIPDIYGQANGSSNNASINNGYNGNASQSQYGQTPAPPVAPPPPPFNGGKFHAKGFIYFVYFCFFYLLLILPFMAASCEHAGHGPNTT